MTSRMILWSGGECTKPQRASSARSRAAARAQLATGAGKSLLGSYPTGRDDQSELPCTSPRAGSHWKFYFLVNAHRAVPCVHVIPLPISHPVFTENPHELTQREHLEGGRAPTVSQGGRRVCRSPGELSVKGWLCMCSSELDSAPVSRHCHVPLKQGTAVILGSQALIQAFLTAVKWKCFENQELRYSYCAGALVKLSMELIFLNFIIFLASIGSLSLAV